MHSKPFCNCNMLVRGQTQIRVNTHQFTAPPGQLGHSSFCLMSCWVSLWLKLCMKTIWYSCSIYFRNKVFGLVPASYMLEDTRCITPAHPVELLCSFQGAWLPPELAPKLQSQIKDAKCIPWKVLGVFNLGYWGHSCPRHAQIAFQHIKFIGTTVSIFVVMSFQTIPIFFTLKNWALYWCNFFQRQCLLQKLLMVSNTAVLTLVTNITRYISFILLQVIWKHIWQLNGK